MEPTNSQDFQIDRPIDLGQISNDVGYNLRRAQLAVFAAFNRLFADVEIRPAQFAVLQVLNQNHAPRQSQVADALGIKRANFVTLLDGLIERDLIIRVPVAEDRRAVTLHLTPRGQTMLFELQRLGAEHKRRVTDRIGEAGRAQLVDLLQRLTDF